MIDEEETKEEESVSGGEGVDFPNDSESVRGTLSPKADSDSIISSPQSPHTTKEPINIVLVFIIIACLVVIAYLFWQLALNEEACRIFYEARMLECQQLTQRGFFNG